MLHDILYGFIQFFQELIVVNLSAEIFLHRSAEALSYSVREHIPVPAECSCGFFLNSNGNLADIFCSCFNISFSRNELEFLRQILFAGLRGYEPVQERFGFFRMRGFAVYNIVIRYSYQNGAFFVTDRERSRPRFSAGSILSISP